MAQVASPDMSNTAPRNAVTKITTRCLLRKENPAKATNDAPHSDQCMISLSEIRLR